MGEIWVVCVADGSAGVSGAAKAAAALVAGPETSTGNGLFDYAAIADISAIARKGPLDSADALARLPLTRSRTFTDDVAVVVGWLDEPSPRS